METIKKIIENASEIQMTPQDNDHLYVFIDSLEGGLEFKCIINENEIFIYNDVVWNIDGDEIKGLCISEDELTEKIKNKINEFKR